MGGVMSVWHGTADEDFGRMTVAFALRFAELGEVGAAVCVYRQGKKVADL